jgi:transcriptional regulator with XRE-family HTH domain
VTRPELLNKITIDIIKSLRKIKKIKQREMAVSLSMSEANYCKIEKHGKEITMRQLIIITDGFGITLRKLITLAEAFHEVDFSNKTVESAFLTIYKTCNYSLVEDFQEENLLEIIGAIKRNSDALRLPVSTAF